GITEHARFRIAARPGNERRRTGGKQIDPIERVVFFVESDHTARDLIFPDVVAIQIELERGFEFARMGATTGKFALPPELEKGLVHREQVPPGGEDALSVGL